MSNNTLCERYPWLSAPPIICAPMRVLSGPKLAAQVTLHGGLGFIGPGANPLDSHEDLSEAFHSIQAASQPRSLSDALREFHDNDGPLPVGIGFQLWNGDLTVAAEIVTKHRPCAVWLFAPRNGQTDIDEWTVKLREAYSRVQVWLQVGTLHEAVAAVESSHAPDVLVVQGSEAGGHGRSKDGMGLMSLLPEVVDTLTGLSSEIPIVAAGGIVDGRGVVAALSLGAQGVAMGTRFLAANEARISSDYQKALLHAEDGAMNTTRTQLYNHLRGTFGWPEEWSPRTVINASYREEQSGVDFETLKQRHDEAVKKGEGWGSEKGRTATYAGASVGLVREVKGAQEILEGIRREVSEILDRVRGLL